jgi:hypothetical protein
VPLFSDGAIDNLAKAYQHAPVGLRPDLAEEPLLSLAELAAASAELDPEIFKRRVHDAKNGEVFALIGNGDAAPELAGSGPVDQWIMLRLVERLPRYRALIERLIGELGSAITGGTGAPPDLKGFIFVSAPHTHTPFHFDAGFNILFQIAGTKIFAKYPAHPPFVGLAERKTYHCNGDNMLGWRPDFAEAATLHALGPGDAVFVPHAAQHWVKVGAQPSISLSVTWQNPWSDRVADALALNPLLGSLGLPVTDPAQLSGAPGWRAAFGKIAQKADAL